MTRSRWNAVVAAIGVALFGCSDDPAAPDAVSQGPIPHISYYDPTNGDLKYAFLGAAGDWVIDTPDEAGQIGSFTSLAFDAAGRPHISYMDSTDFVIYYIKKTAAGWERGMIDSAGYFTSLVLDGNSPHLAYYNQYNGHLGYAVKVGDVWTPETADGGASMGDYCSLELDADGEPHITHFTRSATAIKYATKTAGIWMNETIDDIGSVGGVWPAGS